MEWFSGIIKLIGLLFKSPTLSIPLLVICAIFGGLAYWKHSYYWLIPIPVIVVGALVFFLYLATRYII